MFRVLGGKSKFLYRFIFANFRIFSPLIDLASKKFGGELNALLRTTCAFTQIEGTKGMNVIPPKVSCIANLRLIEGDTKDSAIKHFKKVISDPRIEIEAINGNNPSVISRTDTEGYKKIKTAIQQCWNDTVVSPYLMFACSDSRHWGRISDKVYRFSALTLTKEERASIHGNNEKISLENIAKNYEFYYKLIKKC
jgi:carboxypeptidase PM20D1